MTLPMPEFEHLQSCAGCGHSRDRHVNGTGACIVAMRHLADAYVNGFHDWCPCIAYQPSEEQ